MVGLAGCAAQVSGIMPVIVKQDTAVEKSSPPPGQDPNFVPPGHGGTPPGQAKKDGEDHVPPGHGGTPPGQAKKEGDGEEHVPPGQAKKEGEDAPPGQAKKEADAEVTPAKGKAKGKKK
jgi:hypothetical protein